MRLDCVLVACNENTKYLDFWPLVKQAWWDLAQLPCILVYVGEELPESLAKDPAVKHFKPISGWPTATQAQCIRLLYPSLLKCEGAVMVSDMDMIPMQRDWFVRGFDIFEESQFVSLRGIDEKEQQIYMCYVGATPKIWSSLFSIVSEESIRDRLLEWSRRYPADGCHGGIGWCTDQRILYDRIKEIQREDSSKVGLIPWTPYIPRLDRGCPSEWYEWNDRVIERIRQSVYVDFHMPPWNPFSERLYQILEVRKEALSTKITK